MSFRQGIPSLAALQAFEASARHQSFSKAADELHQTHGAICKKVNQLESSLGVLLFQRVRQRLVLTEAGADYARRIRVHLELIRQDTQQLTIARESSTLHVAIGVTLAAQWLVPRLPSFYAAHPNIQLRLIEKDQATYFKDLNFDAAIHFEQSMLPRLAGKVIVPDDEVWMVAAPSLACEDVASCPWIHTRHMPTAWTTWLDLTGGTRKQPHNVDHFFDFYIMAIQAALVGAGVAILPCILIERELREGKLVRVTDYSFINPEKLYWLFPEQNQHLDTLSAFGNWLEAEIATYREARLNARRSSKMTQTKAGSKSSRR